MTPRMVHGRTCVPLCKELAVPSPYDRERPPPVACAHCGAAAGVACVVRSTGQKLQTFGRLHPSRLEVAA